MEEIYRTYTPQQLNVRRARRRRARRRRLLARIGLVAAALGMAVAIGLGLSRLGSGLQATAAYDAPTYDLSAYVFDATDPRLVVVNNNLPLPDGYAPQTVVADAQTGKALETEAAAAYQEMAAAAAEDGVSLVLCSAYRDKDYQAELFAKRLQKYLDKGYDEEKATAMAQTIVAKPGCSEHQTGLAADIVTEEYTELDSGFAETEAFAWLAANAPSYGFILRYPENRQSATGIIYEPWHWRYVGEENAQAITASGLSLEEFLALHTAAADLAA